MHFAFRIADSPTFGNIRSNVKVVNGPDVRGQRSHDMMTAPRQVTFRLSWLENAYFFTPTIFSASDFDPLASSDWPRLWSAITAY